MNLSVQCLLAGCYSLSWGFQRMTIFSMLLWQLVLHVTVFLQVFEILNCNYFPFDIINLNLFDIVHPKYFVDFSYAKMWPCSLYSQIFCVFFLMTMYFSLFWVEFHFPPPFPYCYRSGWKWTSRYHQILCDDWPYALW